MDIQRLRVLLEVDRTGTFAAAAGALHFTPSAVSQQIARLEAEAGVRLVERGPRGAVLTDAGRALAARARIAIDQLDDARRELLDHADGRVGRLRLCSFPTAASTFVAHAIGVFHRAHPHVHLSMRTAEAWDAVAAVAAGEADLAVAAGFVGEDVRADPRGVTVAPPEVVDIEALFDDPLMLALPADHPLAARPEPLSAADVATAPVLGDREWPGVAAYVDACARAGVEPNLSPFVFNDFPPSKRSSRPASASPSCPPWRPWPRCRGWPTAAWTWAPRRRVWLAAASAQRPPTAAAMTNVMRELADTAGGGWISADPRNPPTEAGLSAR